MTLPTVPVLWLLPTLLNVCWTLGAALTALIVWAFLGHVMCDKLTSLCLYLCPQPAQKLKLCIFLFG